MQNKYHNYILTAEAAPNTAISIPFSQGPSLKSSIIITAPTDWNKVTGRRAANLIATSFKTDSKLNSSSVLLRTDLSCSSETNLKEKNHNFYIL